ncbi:hypothetical protein [Rhizobium leguminosarum]|uniref:Transmembrane protein n=1 Tax=Rhizobium leguminosarum bv. viciae TaxID=387 RepID=A0A8G2J488_RHILV|nr:hypothetical protein [Rhizobium leguminosarum]MBY5619956.1 hypothetical protein [Rhizobium leguminosarum]NKK18608.1 hypothetical protein [Rhizobium leguminosarum bv. viciae]TBX98104.1 hypothetical protein E0H31_04140 [Rhizobium leguminosarum bv. viciae]TBZ10940.1 hypothetical protein E0H52_32585 [Rhizobium leguminosarum bv. viciae]
MSAHGIFSADKQKDLSEQDNIEIYRLLSRGLIVSSDGIISNITNLYGNMIQVLIGLLAAATVLGFFAVRWQSVQSAQEYVDGKTNAFFESKAFRDLVVEKSQQYIDQLDPATNPQVRAEAVSEDLLDIRARIEAIEFYIRNAASPEEPSEPEVKKVTRPRPRKRGEN